MNDEKQIQKVKDEILSQCQQMCREIGLRVDKNQRKCGQLVKDMQSNMRACLNEFHNCWLEIESVDDKIERISKTKGLKKQQTRSIELGGK